MSEQRVEIRGVLASKQGLSCEGFYMLFNRTAHLRDRLYVSVRDGDNLFLPKDPYEHFPCSEIEKFYVERLNVGFFESIGAKGGEVVFILEGPAAEEGAEAIQGALPDVEAATNLTLLPRWTVAIPQKHGYLRATGTGATAAYRPEHLPRRDGPPEPFTPEQAKNYDPDRLKSSLSLFEQKKREALGRWGLLKDYDRAHAQQKKEAKMQQSPWTMQRAHTDYERWKEDLWT
jgi:hypothetical protein